MESNSKRNYNRENNLTTPSKIAPRILGSSVAEDDEDEPSQNPALGTQLKDVAQDWITSSTIHALPRVFKTGPIYLKVIWLIFFLGSLGVCTWIVTNYVITFFQWNTNVNIAIYTESPSNFPAVTFCNLNPFYKRRSQNYIINALKQNNLTYLNNLTSLQPGVTAYSLLSSTLYTIKTYAAVDRNLTTQQRQLLGWNISEMLISCYFNGIQCSTADFASFLDYNYGNCYTFNGNTSNIKQLNTAGPSTGLQMELFVGDGNNDAQFVYETGAYVAIHNQTTSPLTESEGIHVASGQVTNVAIKRTFATSLSYPYSNCIEDNTSPDSYTSDLYKAIFNNLNQKSYRQKYCYRLCYQQSVIASCQCSDPSLPNPYPTRRGNDIKTCYSASDLTCLSNAKTTFQTSSVSTQCSNDCPAECTTPYYYTSISTSSYPTTFYSSWLQLQSNVLQRFSNNQTTSNQISGSMIRLNIFYDDMSYTNITQTQATTWDVLLGNIGGQLGLFLGMSILTFAEIVEIIGELIRTCIVYGKTTKNTRQQPTPVTHW